MCNGSDHQTTTPDEYNQQIMVACREFYKSNNAAHAFVEMLAASDILGEDADYRAHDLMAVNSRVVAKAVTDAHSLVALLEDRIASLEKSS